jgi:hypothetical protein
MSDLGHYKAERRHQATPVDGAVEFLVGMVTTAPDDTSDDEVAGTRSREAVRAAELAAQRNAIFEPDRVERVDVLTG